MFSHLAQCQLVHLYFFFGEVKPNTCLCAHKDYHQIMQVSWVGHSQFVIPSIWLQKPGELLRFSWCQVLAAFTFFQESFVERSLIAVTEEVDCSDGDNSRRNLPISRWVRSGRWFNQWFNCSRNLKHLLILSILSCQSTNIFKVSLMMMSDDLLFYMGLWVVTK